MKKVLYECYETGIITEKSYEYPAMFSTEKKYDILYREELPRFRKNPIHIYGLPFYDTPPKIYNGIGRMGLAEYDEKKDFLTDAQKEMVNNFETYEYAEKLMLTEESAGEYLDIFKFADKHELIWSRISGSDEAVPPDYRFIGYDISYPPSCDGAFSIICDCMFICRWHGCDIEGTLFAGDFDKLNENGLFDDRTSAYNYMIKYLNEEWSERGEYGIFEIYVKEK